MPCDVHFTDGHELTVVVSASEFHDIWMASAGGPVFVDVEGEPVGEWLNPATVVRFHDAREEGGTARQQDRRAHRRSAVAVDE